MEYVRATKDDANVIYELVQNTIKTVYPKYYPAEVVEFFCKHHNMENIVKDIEKDCVSVLKVDEQIVGTGSYDGNHITRVYVSQNHQRNGYGSFIMDCLEAEIAKEHTYAQLDASLPASHMYEQRGYNTLKHERIWVGDGVVLVYEVMVKELPKVSKEISYDGKYFVPVSNSANGEVDSSTLFEYHQKGNVVWASYSGQDIFKGDLIGTVSENGEMDFYYQHINSKNEVRIGKCHSTPKTLEDSRIQLVEEWQWLNGDMSKGSSVLEEQVVRRLNAGCVIEDISTEKHGWSEKETRKSRLENGKDIFSRKE